MAISWLFRAPFSRGKQRVIPPRHPSPQLAYTGSRSQHRIWQFSEALEIKNRTWKVLKLLLDYFFQGSLCTNFLHQDLVWNYFFGNWLGRHACRHGGGINNLQNLTRIFVQHSSDDVTCDQQSSERTNQAWSILQDLVRVGYHEFQRLVSPRGRYFRNFWVGMCRWDPGTLNLYQSKFS